MGNSVSCLLELRYERRQGFTKAVGYWWYGQASGKVWLYNMQCKDSETSLHSCTHNGWGGHGSDCDSHKYDVGVVCSGYKGPPQDNIQLEPGTTGLAVAGIVRVYHNNLWGTVCHGSWYMNDAKVACRQLGFTKALGPMYYGGGSGKVWLYNMQCKGTETSLHSCTHNGWGSVASYCNSHTSDAGVVCTGYEVRLVNGIDPNEGRVEISSGDVWGTVCNDSWGIKESHVICRMLGHEKAVKQHSFGKGANGQNIWLRDISCNGCEDSIIECQRANIGKQTCDHKDDVGVICLPKSKGNQVVSLKRKSDGLLEIQYNGIWRSICAENWDIKDAQVICKMISNFSKAAVATKVKVPAGQQNRVWISKVDCFGNETNIESCKNHTWNWENNNCASGRFRAGVICQADKIDMNLKFSSSGVEKEGSGIVNVEYYGVTGKVCANNFKMNDARVLCRHFGYGEAVNLSPWTKESEINFAIAMNCNGKEASPTECRDFSIRQVVNCDNEEIIGIVCTKKAGHSLTANDITLVSGANNGEGRVQIKRNGMNGTICSDGWDMVDANVLCRMKGFAGAITAYKTFGKGSGPVWFTGMSCEGKEKNIEHCKSEKTTKCSHDQDAGVVCYSHGDISGQLQVNLKNNDSSHAHYGRVQVIFNNTLRTICGDNDWDINDAHVVCRMLNYKRALAAIRQYGKRTSGPSLSNVRCKGHEKSLDKCDHRGWDHLKCSEGFDAGVICESSYANDEAIKVSLTKKASDGFSLVEIEYQGVRGTVCAKEISKQAGYVVCRSSLHSQNVKIVQSMAAYPTNQDLPILLGGVECLGNENNLKDCTSRGIGNTNCDVNNAALGITCIPVSKAKMENMSVDIINTKNKHVGQVHIKENRSSKFLCDTEWDKKDADVICRMKGFKEALAAIKRYKNGNSVKNWFAGLECHGKERSIAECYRKDDDTCPGSHIAGILCKDPSISYGPIKVRLNGSSNSGRLEVRYGNIWGTVCNEGFEKNDADVACHMLGFFGAESLIKHSNASNGIIWLSNLGCKGEEESIDKCTHRGWGQSTCSHDQDVGITCKPAEAPHFRVEQINDITETTARIVFQHFKISKHLKSFFQIGVEQMTFERRLSSSDFNQDNFEFLQVNATKSKAIANNSYMAAEIGNPKNFTIGDGRHYNGYYNAPLERKTAYRVHVRLITMRNNHKVFGKSSYVAFTTQSEIPKASPLKKQSDDSGTVVGLSMIIVILIGVLIGVSVWYVLKQRKEEQLAVAKMQALEMKNRGSTRIGQDKARGYYKAPNAQHQEENEYVATPEDERKALQAYLVQKKIGGQNRQDDEIPTYVDLRN